MRYAPSTKSWAKTEIRQTLSVPLPPCDSMLERFRAVRGQIELKLRDWLEHPEEELRKIREERERQERLEASGREIAISEVGSQG